LLFELEIQVRHDLVSDNYLEISFVLGQQNAMTIAVNNDTSVRLAVNWGEVKFLCAYPKRFKNFKLLF
ncbi:hypothetical protein, partial [Enterococcus faecium]|uniref:hypothetical protein n=1 Tax=Enterococcus faecium TaxID=1352 RepID=UPI000AD0BF4F